MTETARLAKVNINLLPSRRFERSQLGKLFKWTLSWGRYIVIFTELIVLAAFFSRFYFDARLTDLHESIAEKEAILNSAATLEKRTRRIQDKLTVISQLLVLHKPYAKTVRKLAELTPKDLTFLSLELNGNQLTLNSIAYSLSGFNTFWQKMQQSPYFSNLFLTRVNRQSTAGLMINFTLSADLTAQAFQ